MFASTFSTLRRSALRAPVSRLACIALLGAAPLVACGDDGEDGTSQSKQALSYDESCAKMAGWSRSSELRCQTCVAGAKLGCECAKEEPWNGKCEAEAREHAAEPDCDDQLSLCLTNCGSDCACKEDCLAGHDACRAKEEPLQSCLAQICETICK